MSRLAAGLGLLLFAAALGAQGVPDEARKEVVQAIGGNFLVFHDKVAEELKLSEEQKEKLDRELVERIQEAGPFFENLPNVKPPEEREKKLAAFRQKAREKLNTFLKETLKEDQRKRLRQIELQQEGPFVLGGEIGKELKITDAQRKQFMAVAQELQKKIEPLIKEAQSGGKPEEIRPRMMKARREQEAKIVAILTDAQKKQWQEMLGKPFDLGD